MGYEAKLGHGLVRVVAVATIRPGGVVETVIVRGGALLMHLLRSERSASGVPSEGGTILRSRHGGRPDYRIDAETGCWVWQRYIDPQGYGKIRDGRAHRIYWGLVNGPIPEGWHVHHVCRNRACVNPAHLEAVSPEAHFIEHFLTERGLTEQDVLDICEKARDPQVRYVDLVAEYELNITTIMRIVRGISWADKTGGVVEVAHGTCRLCNKQIEGRRSKRYCSRYCRTLYNNRQTRQRAKDVAA